MDLSRFRKTLLSLVFLPYRVVLTSLRQETLTHYLSLVTQRSLVRHPVPLYCTTINATNITANDLTATTFSITTLSGVSGIFTDTVIATTGTITGATGAFTRVVGQSGVVSNTLRVGTITGDFGAFGAATGVNILGTTQVSGATVTGQEAEFTSGHTFPNLGLLMDLLPKVI